MFTKRTLITAALLLTTTTIFAQQKQFFRIGTGGTAGTYYPIGGLIANGISSDKIDASAVATNGSVANVNGIVGGSMESGFAQADVAAWAYTGTGLWAGRGKIETLRAIGNLYPESVHIVVKKGLGIKALAHITGGGFTENIPRVLPKGYVAEVDLTAVPYADVFKWLQEKGGVSEAEMLRTFNCGVGMIVVVSAEDAKATMLGFKKAGETVVSLGTIQKRKSDEPQVRYLGSLQQ